jgi:hypothetical protein
MSDADLHQMLSEARLRNARLDLTGMLLYGDGCFLQVLEGQKPDVDAVYASICQDARNTGQFLIDESEIDERNFPSWSMGFHRMSPDPTEVDEACFDTLVDGTRIEDRALRKDWAVALLSKFSAT